jgi:hypothetical protein
MSKLYITELSQMPADHSIGGNPQVAKLPSLGTQSLTLSGLSARSSVMQANTRFVRVHAAGACHVAVGGAGVLATTEDMPMVAGSVEYFGIEPGAFIAAIEGA